MAYTVLARKYRSRTFDEVVGQQPIATTLVNAINADRIHHGYLFTGTRGVGKTSMARILAKALNCLSADRPTATPCLECDACRSIAGGGDIDVVEIDAASNTGVDNVRELRSNAAYRPARSRFKVYIIDEVHMLSTGAFNALLKTLEEPPGHVKFILATTEIQKVPATIQSRCQRFNFQNIGPSAIADRLTEIVASENAAADPAVLQRVARLANGSMRDALSILDQLLSVAAEKLTLDVLTDVLPPSQDEQIVELFTHAAQGDAAAVLASVENMLAAGRAPAPTPPRPPAPSCTSAPAAPMRPSPTSPPATATPSSTSASSSPSPSTSRSSACSKSSAATSATAAPAAPCSTPASSASPSSANGPASKTSSAPSPRRPVPKKKSPPR